MWINESEIDEAVYRFQHGVLGQAARFLHAFKEQVNQVSDGWAYWQAPSRAADQLMTLVHSHLRSGMGAYPVPPMVTVADFKKTLIPIKAFMTRTGTAAKMTLPEVS